MSTLRTTTLKHGGSTILDNLVLSNAGETRFCPNSSFGRAALYVDGQTNRVGVNTESPGVALDVDGAINATGNTTLGGTLNLSGDFSVGTNPSLFVDTSNTTGRVGIGTSTPTNILEVVNSVNTGNTYIHVHNTSAGNAGVKMQNNAGEWTVVANDRLRIIDDDNARESVSILSNGNIGIGTTSPTNLLDLESSDDLSLDITKVGTDTLRAGIDATGPYIRAGTHIAFRSGGNSEVGRWDSGGRLLVGTSSGGSVARLQVQGSTLFNDAFLDLAYNGAASSGIASGTSLGVLRFTDQASSANIFAQISCAADAAASSGDYPGRLVFSTTADGASNPTERFSIGSNGALKLLAGCPGIDFSARQTTTSQTGASTTYEILDHYEEGTWTPILGSQTGVDFPVGPGNEGWYTRIGDLVFATATFVWLSGGTIGGNVVIKNWPFAAKNVGGYRSSTILGNGSGAIYATGLYTDLSHGFDQGAPFTWLTMHNHTLTGQNYSHFPAVSGGGVIYGLNITYQAG